MTLSQRKHLFSVDVEEYFQVSAFEKVVRPDQWSRYESRVERPLAMLLDLLDEHGGTGTFFTVGWLADRRPDLVRRIAERGHEIASHSWWHRRVTGLSPGEFREDVRRSRAVLEDLTGTPVYGFRAPTFSIIPGGEWAFDVLLEEGYRYDSSLFPIRRPDYGYPSAPPGPHLIHRPGGVLLELPLATTVLAGVRLPAAGGGYLRQLPYALTARAFAEHERRGRSAMFYIHPWEIDPEQPRLPCPIVSRVRHYSGLHRMLPRLRRLLARFRFTSVNRLFDTERAGWRDGEPLAA